MDLDPLAIRNLLIWVALVLAGTILLGGVPSWIRSTAKRADPSAAAAVFALLLALACAGRVSVSGGFVRLLTLSALQYVWIGVCALLSALSWLSLFTALTGGRVSKVMPVYLISSLLTLAPRIFSSARRWVCGRFAAWTNPACIVFIESSTPQIQSQLWFILR
jgi:uncharacterized membrane protein